MVTTLLYYLTRIDSRKQHATHTPVSYTHLDVYKRQIQYMPKTKFFLFLITFFSLIHSHVLVNK